MVDSGVFRQDRALRIYEGIVFLRIASRRLMDQADGADGPLRVGGFAVEKGISRCGRRICLLVHPDVGLPVFAEREHFLKRLLAEKDCACIFYVYVTGSEDFAQPFRGAVFGVRKSVRLHPAAHIL